PHRHVPAVAVATDPQFLEINRQLLRERIDARHDVAKISAAEVLHVRLRKALALSIAPTRVRTQYKVVHRRKGSITRIPLRHACRGRPPVHMNYQWILLRSV